MTTKHPVHIVAGPTASGKSAYAMGLAATHNGTIINADSLQLYDALPILTAAPSERDKAAIPHLLYGVLSPNTPSVSAMDWAHMALDAIRKTLADGRLPIVVGGTGFYLNALMKGLSPIPDIAPEIRVMSQDLFDKIGLAAFFDELQSVDPVIAEKIDRHNPQRLIRAMEVFMGTGKPLSAWQEIPPQPLADDLDFHLNIIMPERDELYARCDQRFDQMIAHGVVDEVRAFDDKLISGKIFIDTACANALGFRPLQEHVRGESDLQSAIYLAKNETHHYAKRQVTWFRHQMTPS